MKLTEMACIQGAWTPFSIAGDCKLLDIGTGTGILSLMLAQRYENLSITAIEIDTEAASQAKENFEQSMFADRIELVICDVVDFNHLAFYDYIIVNPPFFEKQLKSPNHSKNKAWHDESLTLEKLLAAIHKLIKPEGQFSILLPFDRKDELVAEAKKHHFHGNQYLHIRHSDLHAFKYVVAIFSRRETDILTTEMSVKHENQYTEFMQNLMKDFYLI